MATSRRVRSNLRVVGSALGWLVSGLLFLVICASVLVPRVAGATPYTILTGSMTPKYPPGTLMVVRPVDLDRVEVGDVITYQVESGEPTVVTHRVVGVGYRADGERVLTTQGDANKTPDAKPVRAVQVRGELWYAVPWVGHLGVLFSPDQRQRLTYLVAGGLFAYAAGIVVSGWLRNRPRPKARRRMP
ncbi:signal peptidase I [Nocardioides sp. CBS4Y-1]|uniref:Signal peptidase I n=1 Tax=Nocardioides acrostichi TaxID=2784339 RepID=A0A930YAA1_9ACTN|nr:signal peptidase I [Nocardioides acrostichi]